MSDLNGEGIYLIKGNGKNIKFAKLDFDEVQESTTQNELGRVLNYKMGENYSGIDFNDLQPVEQEKFLEHINK